MKKRGPHVLYDLNDLLFSLQFQQEHSVRTAGPPSTLDILRQNYAVTGNAAAMFAGTRHRKSRLAEHYRTKPWSTLLKSCVDHCHVQCIPLEESWPVSFARNDKNIWLMNKAKLIFQILCLVQKMNVRFLCPHLFRRRDFNDVDSKLGRTLAVNQE